MTRNLDEDGAFKPAAQLRQMYESAGVTSDKEVVSYCQGGYRAAHSYLALRLLGYPRVRNYIGVVEGMGRPGRPADRDTQPAVAKWTPSAISASSHTGRSRHVAACVTLLFAVGACAPDPERLRAERTIEAEYDRETGRLELITFDSNDNGTIDTWSYMDGNRVVRIEIDNDEDGTLDRWEYYLEDQTLEKVGFSRGNNGVVDAWAFEGEDGEVVRHRDLYGG